jgi:hypothetical protein
MAESGNCSRAPRSTLSARRQRVREEVVGGQSRWRNITARAFSARSAPIASWRTRGLPSTWTHQASAAGRPRRMRMRVRVSATTWSLVSRNRPASRAESRVRTRDRRRPRRPSSPRCRQRAASRPVQNGVVLAPPPGESVKNAIVRSCLHARARDEEMRQSTGTFLAPLTMGPLGFMAPGLSYVRSPDRRGAIRASGRPYRSDFERQDG